MNVRLIFNIFMMSLNSVIYFSVFRIETKIILKPAFNNLSISGLFWVFCPTIVVLAVVTYHGVWGGLAERKPDVFLKAFVLFNIIPGFFGVLSDFLLRT